MVTVERISQTITPFGGISFVHSMFKVSGLRKLIDKELGIRVSTCGYTGYFPGICAFGDQVVYIENRDGNANVKTAIIVWW